MGWLAVWMDVGCDAGARVGTYKGPIDPSIARLSGTGDGSKEEGETACQGSGVANKEIFCFADANLGEVLKMVGEGRGTTMMVL